MNTLIFSETSLLRGDFDSLSVCIRHNLGEWGFNSLSFWVCLDLEWFLEYYITCIDKNGTPSNEREIDCQENFHRLVQKKYIPTEKSCFV